ncbi:MAG: hypothetical protein A4E32_01763 [Methanomassiliicoccales archaeon PtaU1.Bin124]|nr:MAG: hypothetical protein A4E32_01763 [Methanomassiliicoccales archaeon PtaU1.Bin124]
MSLYKAHLIGVYEHGEMPEELIGFVKFQANRQKYAPQKEDKVAVLQIVGTTSYFPIFLNTVKDMKQIDEGLREVDAELDEVSRLSLQRILQEKHK